MDPRLTEVHRLLDRYLVEIVETYGLCPWARAARVGGEITVDVLWATPSVEGWVAAAERALALPQTRVAMVIAPELRASPADLRAIRDEVARVIPSAGVADFHPDAPLDLATPARLVPYLRRSPDRMLQLVPLAILDVVRAPPPSADLAHQAQILGGHASAPREDVADRIAATNLGRVHADAGALAERLADIAADRARSYARAGIR